MNDLLHLFSDTTLSVTYNTQDKAVRATHINNTPQNMLTWGNTWQVKFAPNNTHFAVVSRTFPTIKHYFDDFNPRAKVETFCVFYER